MSTIKAVVQRRAGDPADVLEIADVDSPPAPGPGQVTVAVTMFPVHPGDLQMIATSGPGDGRPAGVGAEATGVVVTAGPGVTVSVGTRVSMFLLGGLWRERVTVSVADVVPVPDSLSDEVAAQLLINPITVLMLRRAAQRHVSVGFDGVILNNAAASSVGRLFTAGGDAPPDRHHQHRAQRRPGRATGATLSGCSQWFRRTSADWQDRVRDAAARASRSRWRWTRSVATQPRTCCRCWTLAGRRSSTG